MRAAQGATAPDGSLRDSVGGAMLSAPSKEPSSAQRRPLGWARRRGPMLLSVAATLWFAGAACWEIGAPFGAGHYAAASAVGVAGENAWRFGTLVPITHHPFGPVGAGDYYTHHPFLIFWVQALFSGLFGHHDYACRLPAVVWSAVTPLVLFQVGRALYGAWPAALATLGFVFTPIALSFASFNALEVPLIFGTLLTLLGVLRVRELGRPRDLALALGGLTFALNTDWPAFVLAGVVLFVSLLAALDLPRAPGSRRHPLLVFVIAGSALTIVVGLAYVVAFWMLGTLDDLLAQGQARSQGAGESLLQTLAARQYWLLLMFTPFAPIVMALAVPVMLGRAKVQREAFELLPFALLAMATFHYVVFKQGADVHVFWPHTFSAFFALALAATSQTASRLRHGRTPAIALAFVPMLMAPDAIRTLVYAHKTGGRFDENNRFIQPDKDKVAALDHLRRVVPKDATFALAPNMRQSLWVPWVLGRPARTAGSLDAFAEHYFVTDGRFESFDRLRRVSAQRAVLAIGPFWIVDHTSPVRPIVAASIDRYEARGLARFFGAATHAERSVNDDPFLTWELRDHLDQTPNPWPASEPKTFEQLRILHNAAIARGEGPAAERHLERLLRGVDRSMQAEYEDGTALLGVRLETGASNVLTVYFRASGPLTQSFHVRSRLETGPFPSFVPADRRERTVGLPPFISTSAWKRGYVYSSITELLSRPGKERFVGAWNALAGTTQLRARDGRRELTLLVFP